MMATDTKAHRFMHGDDWTLECLDCDERRDPEADTKGECKPRQATAPAVACKFCASEWSVVHEFVQAHVRLLTVSATGGLTDEMVDSSPDGGAGSQDEWHCIECGARSTNRDSIAEVRRSQPLAADEFQSEEPTGPLFDQVRQHGDGCPNWCQCWT
jgi:hypothetical protein